MQCSASQWKILGGDRMQKEVGKKPVCVSSSRDALLATLAAAASSPWLPLPLGRSTVALASPGGPYSRL